MLGTRIVGSNMSTPGIKQETRCASDQLPRKGRQRGEPEADGLVERRVKGLFLCTPCSLPNQPRSCSILLIGMKIGRTLLYTKR